MVYHKHTQYPGPGRTNGNVVGYPVFPVYAAKAGGFFLIVFGVLTLMGATMQINPVWVFRALQPGGSDRRLSARLVHGLRRGRHSHHAELGMAHRIDDLVVERANTWSRADGPVLRLDGHLPVHRGLGHGRQVRASTSSTVPANNPCTAFGVAAMTGYAMLWIGGGNDLVAVMFDVSLNAVTYVLRVAVFVAPVLAFLITKRICIGLQRSDRDRMLTALSPVSSIAHPREVLPSGTGRSVRARRSN